MSTTLSDESLLALALDDLKQGKQSDAEVLLTQGVLHSPGSPSLLFWNAVCIRSRFDIREAARAFARVLTQAPGTLEATTSACMLGIDLSRDSSRALEFYQRLLALGRKHPEDDGIRWLSALAARSILRLKDIPDHLRLPLLNQGISDYQLLLAKWSPDIGPVLVHQTLANLLDDRSDETLALPHRELAVQLERRSWSLEAYATTLAAVGRYEEAIPAGYEAIAQNPENGGAYKTLGYALWMTGRRVEALDVWREAARRDGPASLVDYGRHALEIGEWTRAWNAFSAASAVEPQNQAIKIYLARTAVHLNQPGASEKIPTAGCFDFKGDPVPGDVSDDPWIEAATTGDVASLKKLAIDQDINRQFKDHYNANALMWTAQSGWSESLQTLLDLHAQLNLRDVNGSTALHYAAQFDQPDCVRRLLLAGANPNLHDRWGQTPLINAISSSCPDAVGELVTHGADLSIATAHGGTPLDYAMADHDSYSLQLLLAHGADANAAVPSTGQTPLMMLCWKYRNFSFLKPLLASGADVHLKDKRGLTALHYALVPDLNEDLVAALLTAGADSHAASYAGITPVTLARALGYEKLALKMDSPAGTREAFHLADMPALSPTESPACRAFTLPVRLALGQPYNLLIKGQKPDRTFARDELKTDFGLTDAKDIRAAITRINFNVRYDAPDPVSNQPSKNESMLLNLTEATLTPEGKMTPPGCSAWVQSHRIYLAELGLLAGYLSAEESSQIVQEASLEISQHVHNWTEFSASFLAGAERFEGWNRSRYQHLCDLAQGAAWSYLPWPAPI